MRILLLVVIGLIVTSCASSADEAQSIFDRLEFEEGQEGCLRVNGQLNVGGNPFAQSDINVSLVKSQGENAPDC